MNMTARDYFPARKAKASINDAWTKLMEARDDLKRAKSDLPASWGEREASIDYLINSALCKIESALEYVEDAHNS